ncbi:DUF6787 family protein [Niabella sp. 22666]|jgi:hypothetical protein|uniref:DUF6787 family protein n=1 Tax=Niabella sp. 22666 TaxID=3453954 RepID=UPI003F85D304
MLNRLRQKWKVGPLQLFLILCTFAVGGSLSGYVGRRLMLILPINNKVLYTIIYIILVTLIWPLMVLGVSIIFGQYAFFKKYLRELFRKITRKRANNE